MKHSLAVEFRLKWKKVPSLIINGFNLRSCFLLRQKCILGRSLPPLGLYYSPRFARGCKADPRGVKTALGNTFPWAGINFLGEIHLRWRKVTLSIFYQSSYLPGSHKPKKGGKFVKLLSGIEPSGHLGGSPFRQTGNKLLRQMHLCLSSSWNRASTKSQNFNSRCWSEFRRLQNSGSGIMRDLLELRTWLLVSRHLGTPPEVHPKLVTNCSSPSRHSHLLKWIKITIKRNSIEIQFSFFGFFW